MPEVSKSAMNILPSPFTQTLHGNPNFQPSKMGSKSINERLPKPPKAPERPLMPYMRYSRKVWEQVKITNPLLKLWEVGKIIGQMWRELPDDGKQEYVEEYESEKMQYNEAMRQYHNSPQYQGWLAAKERAERGVEEEPVNDFRMRGNMSNNNMKRVCRPGEDVESREAYIHEDMEEDLEEALTMKHVAYARFQRNQYFLADIMSDTKVPDARQIVTQQRLQTLKRQVDQLVSHQEKLTSELNVYNKVHEEAKQLFQEQSDRFLNEYKILCSQCLDFSHLESHIDEYVENFLKSSTEKAPLIVESEEFLDSQMQIVVQKSEEVCVPIVPDFVESIESVKEKIEEPETVVTGPPSDLLGFEDAKPASNTVVPEKLPSVVEPVVIPVESKAKTSAKPKKRSSKKPTTPKTTSNSNNSTKEADNIQCDSKPDNFVESHCQLQTTCTSASVNNVLPLQQTEQQSLQQIYPPQGIPNYAAPPNPQGYGFNEPSANSYIQPQYSSNYGSVPPQQPLPPGPAPGPHVYSNYPNNQGMTQHWGQRSNMQPPPPVNQYMANPAPSGGFPLQQQQGPPLQQQDSLPQQPGQLTSQQHIAPPQQHPGSLPPQQQQQQQQQQPPGPQSAPQYPVAGPGTLGGFQPRPNQNYYPQNYGMAVPDQNTQRPPQYSGPTPGNPCPSPGNYHPSAPAGYYNRGYSQPPPNYETSHSYQQPPYHCAPYNAPPPFNENMYSQPVGNPAYTHAPQEYVAPPQENVPLDNNSGM